MVSNYTNKFGIARDFEFQYFLLLGGQKQASARARGSGARSYGQSRPRRWN